MTRLPLRLQRLHRDEDGAAVTEFAIAFSLYVLLVVGLLQVSLWALTGSLAQFAVWEGCRAGAAAYQPPPPDGTGVGSVGSQLPLEDSAYEARAKFTAVDRMVEILNWLPLTQEHQNYFAEVDETGVGVGEEGRREIYARVEVQPVVLFPFARDMLGPLSPSGWWMEKTCRLRLTRYYSF